MKWRGLWDIPGGHWGTTEVKKLLRKQNGQTGRETHATQLYFLTIQENAEQNTHIIQLSWKARLMMQPKLLGSSEALGKHTGPSEIGTYMTSKCLSGTSTDPLPLHSPSLLWRAILCTDWMSSLRRAGNSLDVVVLSTP